MPQYLSEPTRSVHVATERAARKSIWCGPPWPSGSSHSNIASPSQAWLSQTSSSGTYR
jgi:hypothetical protein